MNKITKEDIRVRYKEYNRLYFGNQLKHCKFSVQKMSWCEGMYTYKKEKDGIIEGRIWLTDDVDWTEETLREAIIHEMIHHFVRTIDRKWGGLFGHGRLFRRQCKRLKRDFGLTIPIHSKLPRINNKRTILWRLTKLLFPLFALILVSCECPYQDELDRAQYRKSSTGDVFHADVLLGTWQCYYPMIIGGMEFKQIKFMSGGKADITMAKPHDTEWNTMTYNYAYYGNTLRFSRSGSNISLTVEGYLFPELYLRDSFGRYTMAKRRADGC